MLECSSDIATDSSFTAIVAAIITDSPEPRSSGSLESTSTSTGSNISKGSSLSPPSLEASSSTSSTNSAASSTNPSPCPSILRSNSSQTFPSRSATPSPSISFAPLPQTEPRKRNSSHQLGVAARSRLLRHRRMLREQGLDHNSVPYPYGPGSGVAGGRGYTDSFDDSSPVEIREAQAGVDADEEAGARGHRGRLLSNPSEDSLPSLGKLFKGAGKTLWKSLSMRDMRSKEAEDVAPPVGDAGSAEGAGKENVEEAQGEHPAGGSLRVPRGAAQRSQKKAVHLFEEPEARTPSADGGVWEEEIAEESWKKLLSDAPTTSEPEKVADSPPATVSRSGSIQRTTKIEAGRMARTASAPAKPRSR